MKRTKKNPGIDGSTIKAGRSSTHVRDDGNIDVLIPLKFVSGPNSPDEILALLPSEPQYTAPGDPMVYGELWGYTDSEIEGGMFKLRAIFRQGDSLTGAIGLLNPYNRLIRVVQASMTLERLTELGARGRVLSPPMLYSVLDAEG